VTGRGRADHADALPCDPPGDKPPGRQCADLRRAECRDGDRSRGEAEVELYAPPRCQTQPGQVSPGRGRPGPNAGRVPAVPGERQPARDLRLLDPGGRGPTGTGCGGRSRRRRTGIPGGEHHRDGNYGDDSGASPGSDTCQESGTL